MEGKGISGMSGGGAFNNEGEYLGVLVRSSESKSASSIIRVVRINYIRKKKFLFYNSLSIDDKLKLRPFISGEF